MHRRHRGNSVLVSRLARGLARRTQKPRGVNEPAVRHLVAALEAARVAAGCSTAELARQVGVSPSAFREWRSGRGLPGAKSWAKLQGTARELIEEGTGRARRAQPRRTARELIDKEAGWPRPEPRTAE